MRPCGQADGLTSQLSAGSEDGREQVGKAVVSCSHWGSQSRGAGRIPLWVCEEGSGWHMMTSG